MCFHIFDYKCVDKCVSVTSTSSISLRSDEEQWVPPFCTRNWLRSMSFSPELQRWGEITTFSAAFPL